MIIILPRCTVFRLFITPLKEQVMFSTILIINIKLVYNIITGMQIAIQTNTGSAQSVPATSTTECDSENDSQNQASHDSCW